jgi:DNA-binding transcriptional LysR family regulator
MAMALNSDFIATVPAPFARWCAFADQLHLFRLPVPTPAVNIALSWHPRHHADPVHCWLREHVRITTQTLGCVPVD